MRESPTAARLVLRLDEAAPLQGGGRRLHLVAAHLRGQRTDGRSSEPTTLDGGPLEDQARHGVEAVQTCRDERLQRTRGSRSRHGPDRSSRPSTRRPWSRSIAVSCSTYSGFPSAVSQIRSTTTIGVSSPSKSSAIRRVSAGARGGRVVVTDRGFPAAQLGRCSRSSGRARHRKSDAAVHVLDDRVHQVEHRGLRPMHVLEHHDEGPLRRQDFEQAPHRPRGVGAERVADPEEPCEAVADGGAVRLRGQSRAKGCRHLFGFSRRPPSCLRQQFDERRERDALTVGRGLSDEDRRPFPDLRDEGIGQPRLPHPGRSQDRDEHAGIARRSRPAGPLRGSSCGGRARRTASRSGSPTAWRDTTRQAETGSALPLTCSGSTASATTASRTRRQVDSPINTLAGLGSRLQARRGVHRVADDRCVTARHQDLARGRADPGRERDPRAPRSAIARRSCISTAARTARSAVVLVRDRQPEDAHHRVADELLHPTAVALDGRAHLGEVALHHRAQHLRIVGARRASSNRPDRRTRP